MAVRTSFAPAVALGRADGGEVGRLFADEGVGCFDLGVINGSDNDPAAWSNLVQLIPLLPAVSPGALEDVSNASEILVGLLLDAELNPQGERDLVVNVAESGTASLEERRPALKAHART
jgi:hypothetical protein